MSINHFLPQLRYAVEFRIAHKSMQQKYALALTQSLEILGLIARSALINCAYCTAATWSGGDSVSGLPNLLTDCNSYNMQIGYKVRAIIVHFVR